MARKFLTPIDLTGLELTNFKVQNLGTDPSAYGKGHTYYNTAHNELRVYDGSQWVAVGGAVEFGTTSSRPVAGNAGRVYADTQTYTWYLDNGTSWIQIGVNADDVASAISAAALTSTDGLSEGTTNLYYTNSRVDTELSNTFGISKSGSDLVINPSGGSSFIGSNSDTNNRIATIGDLTSGSVQSVTGTTNQITATTTLEAVTLNLPLDVKIDQSLQIGGWNDADNGFITVKNYLGTNVLEVNSNLSPNDQYHGYNTYTNATGVININSFVNLSSEGNTPAGFLYVNANGGASTYPTVHLEATGDLALRAGANGNDGNIILYTGSTSGPGTGKVYIGWNNAGGAGANASNQVATIGDINDTKYVTSVDTNIFNVDSGTLQLNSVVNDINGEIHLKKNEYWIDGDTGTQYGVVVANQYSGHFNVVAVGRDLELEAQSGNTIWLNTTGTVAATYNGDYNAFAVDTGAAVTTVRNRLETVNNDGYVTISSNGNNESLTFNSAYYDQYVGAIKTDGTGFKIEGGSSGLTISTTGNDITLSPDSNLQVNSDLYVNGNHSLHVAGGIYSGGADYEYDGYLQIKDANGNNVVVMGGNNGDGYIETHGVVNLYQGYNTNGGAQYAAIGSDGDNNLIINAYNNNLVLQADSSKAYISYVDPANKIIVQSDLTALSSGLDWKQAANLLMDAAEVTALGVTVDGGFLTSSITDGTFTIDSHSITNAQVGYRLLVVGTGDERDGIWEISAVAELNWTATRPVDADVYSELIGAAIFIEEGTKYAATSWVQNNHYITNFTSQTWNQFSGQGTYTAGNGIDISGRAISVKINGDTLSESGSGLSVNLADGGGLSTDGGVYVMTHNGIIVDGGGYVTVDTNVVARKYSQDITYTGTPTTPFSIVHNLDTKHVQVTVFEIATGEDVVVDIARPDNNTITVDFAVIPGSGEYTVVVVG